MTKKKTIRQLATRAWVRFNASEKQKMSPEVQLGMEIAEEDFSLAREIRMARSQLRFAEDYLALCEAMQREEATPATAGERRKG